MWGTHSHILVLNLPQSYQHSYLLNLGQSLFGSNTHTPPHSSLFQESKMESSPSVSQAPIPTLRPLPERAFPCTRPLSSGHISIRRCCQAAAPCLLLDFILSSSQWLFICPPHTPCDALLMSLLAFFFQFIGRISTYYTISLFIIVLMDDFHTGERNYFIFFLNSKSSEHLS